LLVFALRHPLSRAHPTCRHRSASLVPRAPVDGPLGFVAGDDQ